MKKKKCECKENKQAQAVISIEKAKRKSHQRRKIVPLNDRVDEGLRCEERT